MNNVKIKDIDLSVRAYNCLTKAGVDNIEQMALIDLNTLEYCGRKTKEEISDRIKKLVEDGYYSPEFISEYLKEDNIEEDFIDTLNLSVRSKNILKNQNIDCPEKLLLLNYEKLSAIRNAGTKSINEILVFIENNKNSLMNEVSIEEFGNVYYPINLINYFCGETLLTEFTISQELSDVLRNYNIFNIYNLVTNKLVLDDFPNIKNEYNRLYNYFYNLSFGPMKLSINNFIRSTYIKIPFELLGYYEKDEMVHIEKYIDILVSNFSKLDLRSQINVKLFAYWINLFQTTDTDEFLDDILSFNDRDKEVLSKRTYMSLNEVGELFNITRERVRQIESKALLRAQNKYLKFPFKLLLGKEVYYVDECNEKELILLYLDENYDQFYINTKIDNRIVFFQKKLVDKIEKYIKEHNELIEYNGYFEAHNLSNNPINQELLKISANYLDLNIHNGHISNNMPKKMQVKYAMRLLKKNISLSSDEDKMLIINTVRELFGEELENSRGLEGIIETVGIRVNNGTYSADDIVMNLDKNTLNEIINYVRQKEIINTRDLFIPFGKILIEHNLNNEVILYRYLKESLEGILYFHGVSAVISSKKELSCWGDVVGRDIKLTGKPINKLEFISKYALTEAVYNNLPINFSDIIAWSSKELYLKSELKYSKELCDKLMSIIQEKQIISFDGIRIYLEQFSPNILEINNIKSDANLSCFLGIILTDDFVVDKGSKEVRYKVKKDRYIEKKFTTIEELTL